MLLSFRSVILYCLAFCINTAWMAPILDQRQNDAGQSKTVTTVKVINTPEGPLTQTCVITLTPTTDSSGNPAVKEVEDCNLTPGTTKVPAPASSSAPSTSSPAPPPASQSPSPSAPVPTPSGKTASPTPSSPSPSASTPTPSGKTASPTPSSPSPSASTPTPSGNTASTAPASSSAPSSSTSSSVSSPASSSTVSPSPLSAASSAPANQASASPTAKFQIPGKNLSVLPIGLGVFAGIVVIALIVVGLVTYERTRYRKAFRERRLADTGANMGYGGSGINQV